MKSVVFDGCFGWIHAAPGAVGVVMCKAAGHEALWTHRGLRHISDQLAAQGVPSLRFDYHGTGDSRGVEEDPERIETWIQNIISAVATLKAETGVTRVVLLGLRFGATLATLAAERLGDVLGVIMMAPVVNGSSYLRELRILQNNWINTSAAHITQEPLADQVTEALGYRFYPELTKQLSALDLRRDGPLPAPHILILDAFPRSPAKTLADRYVGLGGEVLHMQFDEYARWMTETGENRNPLNATATVAAWVKALPGARANLIGVAPNGATARIFETPEPCLEIDDTAVLHAEGAIEKPVVFGGGRLFGIHTRPASGRPASMAVLFPNTGGNHHIGDGRSWVVLGRRLAQLGIASLRMDVDGLGDSLNPGETSSNDVLYSSESAADVSMGIEWLRAQKYDKVIALGVCSGAYLSLHAALCAKEIEGLILVNLQKFIWTTPEITYEKIPVMPTRVYMRSLRKLSKWRRVIAGEVKMWSIVSGIVGRAATRRWLKIKAWFNKMRGIQNESGNVQALMRELDGRGIKTQLIYGDFDPGLEECEMHFGRNLSGLKRMGSISVQHDPRVDHALFLYGAREAVWNSLRSFLADNFKTAGEVALPFPMIESIRERSAVPSHALQQCEPVMRKRA